MCLCSSFLLYSVEIFVSQTTRSHNHMHTTLVLRMHCKMRHHRTEGVLRRLHVYSFPIPGSGKVPRTGGAALGPSWRRLQGEGSCLNCTHSSTLVVLAGSPPPSTSEAGDGERGGAPGVVRPRRRRPHRQHHRSSAPGPLPFHPRLHSFFSPILPPAEQLAFGGAWLLTIELTARARSPWATLISLSPLCSRW